MADDCIFCQIVAGQAPAHRVAEDDLAVAFCDIFPVAAGHTLVIPRQHAANVFEIDEEPMRATAALARRVSHALRDALAPEGLAVYQANGAAAGQTVWHYHVHLIPRNEGEPLAFHGRTRADDAELVAMAKRIAEHLPG
jgi:histidine triad (HIT) family protein